jgi:hypothetical protein
MGVLSIYIPFTSSNLIVSNFSLCGIPFLAGFYSKDFILEMFSMRYVNILYYTTLEMELRPCPGTGFCKHGNKPCRPKKDGQFLHYFVNLRI